MNHFIAKRLENTLYYYYNNAQDFSSDTNRWFSSDFLVLFQATHTQILHERDHMEQPALIQRSSPLKWIVCLLGIICTVALCFPSASRLISYYQAVSMVKAFPFQLPNYSYNKQYYAPDLSRTLAFDTRSKKGIIWDYASQRIIQQITLNYTVYTDYPELAWSPDQRYLLYHSTLPNSQGEELTLWDLVGQKKVFSVSGDYHVSFSFQSAVWSPDATRIALLENNEITIIDATTGRVLAAPQPMANGTSADTIAWSPDSKLLALADNTIKETSPQHFIYIAWVNVMNTATRRIVSEPLRPTTTDEIRDMRLAWSPDGRSIAASFGDQLWLLNPYDGAKARRVNDQYNPLDYAALPAWSSDSTRLAVFGAHDSLEKELAIWRIADLQKVQVVEQGDLSDATELYWPPKAQHLLLTTTLGDQETLPLSLW